MSHDVDGLNGRGELVAFVCYLLALVTLAAGCAVWLTQ